MGINDAAAPKGATGRGKRVRKREPDGECPQMDRPWVAIPPGPAPHVCWEVHLAEPAAGRVCTVTQTYPTEWAAAVAAHLVELHNASLRRGSRKA